MESSAAATRELEHELSGLYEAHAAALLQYALSLARTGEEARDAVQETFLRYFKERRYGRRIEHPRSWLFQVLHNYLMGLVRTEASRRELAVDTIEELPDVTQNPESLTASRESARAIAAALSAREMRCLRLRAEGWSYVEISRLLHIRPGTVGAFLARAYQKLSRPPGKNGTIKLNRVPEVLSIP